MIENSSGWEISSKLSRYFTEALQEESVVICPEYPPRVEDKKIEKIAVNILNSENIQYFKHEVFGEGEPTGKVIFRMTYCNTQFGYSSINIQINYSYSYNETYLKEKIEEYLDYEFPNYQPYMNEAKDQVLIRAMNDYDLKRQRNNNLKFFFRKIRP